MRYASIILLVLSIMAVHSVGDTLTFATAPAADEIAWNNTGNVTYGATIPTPDYSTPSNPAGLYISTGYDRYARVGATSNQFGRMTLTPDSETDTAMVSLEFANTVSTAVTAGIGTSVGITKASMNLYNSQGLKVSFVNDGTAARNGRLMYSTTTTTDYIDFTGRSAADNITLESGKWYKIVGYFTKTSTDNLWDITVQLWNITDSVKVEEISQAGITQEYIYDGGEIVAGLSINRSSATYSENLTWDVQQIPEPATLALSMAGVVMFTALRKKK